MKCARSQDLRFNYISTEGENNFSTRSTDRHFFQIPLLHTFDTEKAGRINGLAGLCGKQEF
jgi:hypothetical protein